MARNPRDGSPSTEQEITGLKDGGDAAAAAAAARSRAAPWTTWQGLRDPRVVRVSRAFGGKDRHSKVSTVRGLRDRRVRLSVQTAIQLYDLQDRLGLNQPSKVVDWLLDTTQHEIDKLPPLQIPPGSCLFQYYPPAPPPTDGAGAGGTAPDLGQLLGRLPAESRPPPPVSAASAAADYMGGMGIKGDGSDHHQRTPSMMVTDQYHGADPAIPIHSNLHSLGFLSLPGGGGNLPAASYCLQLEASSNVFAPLHMDGYSTSLQQQAEEEAGYRPGCSPPAPSLSLSHAPAQLLLSSSEAEAAAPSKFPPYYEPRHAHGGGAALQMTGFSGSWQGSKQNQFI